MGESAWGFASRLTRRECSIAKGRRVGLELLARLPRPKLLLELTELPWRLLFKLKDKDCG